MKFISRHSAHKITVDPGTQSAILSPGGVTTFRDNGDMLMVEFELRTLTVAEIEAAKDQLFAGAKDGQAFGSTPSRDEGILNVDEGVAAGYADLNYEAYDVYQSLSQYDTNDPRQCPPARREEVEAFLLTCDEYGRSFVRVDNYNLTPPWPTYPLGATVNVADVARFAQVGGLLNEALAYEQATLQRSELIAAYEELLVTEVAKAQEDAGLTATV